MMRFWVLCLAIAGAVQLMPWIGGPAHAQGKFAGVTLSPAPPNYLILADVNVRAKPRTKSKRVGRFRKGSRVTVAGRAKGTKWLAVKKDGTVLGFIYGTAMAALIDGRLTSDLIGNTKAPGGQDCRYTLKFEGKSQAAEELLITSDYRVMFRCRQKKKRFTFEGIMFITEIPYVKSADQVYQINIDLFEITSSIEDALTVIVMYHRKKGEVIFDSLSEKNLLSGKQIKKRPAKAVITALKGAIDIAVSAWGPKVWAELNPIRKK